MDGYGYISNLCEISHAKSVLRVKVVEQINVIQNSSTQSNNKQLNSNPDFPTVNASTLLSSNKTTWINLQQEDSKTLVFKYLSEEAPQEYTKEKIIELISSAKDNSFVAHPLSCYRIKWKNLRKYSKLAD